jgi:hypothetical protein
VPFDGGNALKGVIDFFLEAGDILDLFSEIVEAILLLISVMSSATAAEPRSIFPSRSAKPRSTVERTLSSVALGFLVGFFFASICGEYSTTMNRRCRGPGSERWVTVSQLTEIGKGERGNWKRGACGLDAACITDFNRGEASGARG